uniref:Diguanylate cyclase n=1 Tax=Cyanothece sp. (strain PCC 7425 / ATCC 29141) TaxID=395961 RepID=B8HMA6_CYAP4
MEILSQLERLSLRDKILLGYFSVGIIGILDFWTGHELSFSTFYLLPIAFTTWYLGQKSGITTSIISSLTWLLVDILSGNKYSSSLIPIWNASIRFSFFLIITLLLSSLKNAMDRERELSRTDYLTGAANSRFFYENLQIEIDRLKRYKISFTIVYVDLDDFKKLNDESGHIIGDMALSTVATYAKRHLRKTDLVARLGGDEFVFLLPGTSQKDAHIVLSKLQYGLLEEMQKNSWPITFSIGVLTCNASIFTPKDLIKMADVLMSEAKNSGKNTVRYFIC